ncbi:GDSL esterase/lipase At1g29670-like [Nymphaea colorata]|nr:GDSL esterase/lipase At1g29670-like [Nymphaea colorata]
MPAGSNIFSRTKNNGSDEDFLNEADSYLNHQLKYALDGMSRDKPGFSFVYVNIFHMVMSMLDDPTAYGLKVTNETCCTLSASSGDMACAEGVAPCSDRSIYLFYDAVHQTESVYVQLSTKAFFSKLDTEVYPFNVNVLANLTLDVGASSNVQPWSDA